MRLGCGTKYHRFSLGLPGKPLDAIAELGCVINRDFERADRRKKTREGGVVPMQLEQLCVDGPQFLVELGLLLLLF